MVEQIHQAPGGNFRSVDMIIPRILELEQRNRQRLADGTVKMNEIIKVTCTKIKLSKTSRSSSSILDYKSHFGGTGRSYSFRNATSGSTFVARCAGR